MRFFVALMAAVAAMCSGAHAECNTNSSPQSCYTDGIQQIVSALAQMKEAAVAQKGLATQVEQLRNEVTAALSASSGSQFEWLSGLWCADNGFKVSRSLHGNMLIESIQAFAAGAQPPPMVQFGMPTSAFLLVPLDGDPVIIPLMVRFHRDGQTIRFLTADGSPLPNSVTQKKCT